MARARGRGGAHHLWMRVGSWTTREGGARTRLLAELARGREEGVIVALLAPAAEIAQLARPRAVRQALQQEVDSSPGKVDVRHDARSGDGDAGDDVARGPPGAVPAGYGHQSARPLGEQRQQQLSAIERMHRKIELAWKVQRVAAEFRSIRTFRCPLDDGRSNSARSCKNLSAAPESNFVAWAQASKDLLSAKRMQLSRQFLLISFMFSSPHQVHFGTQSISRSSLRGLARSSREDGSRRRCMHACHAWQPS